MVVFGDNMMHEQLLMKKRNRAYIEQMLGVLRAKFKESKEPSNAAGGGIGSEHGGGGGGGHDSTRQTGSSTQTQGQPQQSTTTTTSSLAQKQGVTINPRAINPQTASTTSSALPSYGTKAREEKSLTNNPNNAPK